MTCKVLLDVYRETRKGKAALSVATNVCLLDRGFHGTRFYIAFMSCTSLCKGMRSPCKQRKEVMVKLASVFHTEASQGEPPNLCQFSGSHEIQPHGLPISQDERQTHERSATYRFLYPVGQGYFPGDAAVPAEQDHPVCERWKTPRESRVNA